MVAECGVAGDTGRRHQEGADGEHPRAAPHRCEDFRIRHGTDGLCHRPHGEGDGAAGRIGKRFLCLPGRRAIDIGLKREMRERINHISFSVFIVIAV